MTSSIQVIFVLSFVRFLQTAEMLKPPMPTTSRNEELTEYFPHVVFVHNKAQYSDYTQNMISTMQVKSEDLFSILSIIQALALLLYFQVWCNKIFSICKMYELALYI